jgi:uncharacterized protein (TIGR02001 family)
MHPVPGVARQLRCFALGVALCVAKAAHADGSVGGHIDVTTDYVFRGISQTLGDPAIQGDLHYQTVNGWFLGGWASTVNLNHGPGSTVELNAYAGRAWSLGDPWNARVTAVQYMYPNDSATLRYDYFELLATLAYQDRLGLTVSWSPDTSRYSAYGIAENRQTLAYELVGRWPVQPRVSLTGSVGYYDLSELFGTGYWHGSAGLTGTVGRFRVDLAYFETGQEAIDLFGAETAGDRWALTIAWSF